MAIKSLMMASAAGAAVLATAVGGIVQAAPAKSRQASVTYVAKLLPLNAEASGRQTHGEARFTVRSGKLIIDIRVSDAAPNIEHWQHIHGFKDDRVAACPTADADANHDGVIDLIETEPASGTTMIPFNGAPASMKIPTDTYPKASAKGSYAYRKTVSLKALEAGFDKAFGSRKLDLDHRVVIIHGVASNAKLPTTVASLGPIPAHVTLPIACGKIERVAK